MKAVLPIINLLGDQFRCQCRVLVETFWNKDFATVSQRALFADSDIDRFPHKRMCVGVAVTKVLKKQFDEETANCQASSTVATSLEKEMCEPFLSHPEPILKMLSLSFHIFSSLHLSKISHFCHVLSYHCAISTNLSVVVHSWWLNNQ